MLCFEVRKKPNTFESATEAMQGSSNKVKDLVVWVCTMGSLRQNMFCPTHPLLHDLQPHGVQ